MLHFMLISIVISEIPHLRQIPIQMPDSRAVQGCQVRDGGGRTDVRLLSTIVHNKIDRFLKFLICLKKYVEL